MRTNQNSKERPTASTFTLNPKGLDESCEEIVDLLLKKNKLHLDS